MSKKNNNHTYKNVGIYMRVGNPQQLNEPEQKNILKQSSKENNINNQNIKGVN